MVPQALEEAPSQPQAPQLDRGALAEVLAAPGTSAPARAVLIAAFGHRGHDLDLKVAAAATGQHPARLRHWLKPRPTPQAAGVLLREALAVLYPVTGGGIDVDELAGVLEMTVPSVKRLLRTELAPSAAAALIERVLLAAVPSARIRSVDLAAAAAGLGIKPETVRRWLNTTSSERPCLPAARAQQLLQLTEPSPQVLERERLAVEHAHECLRRLALGRGRGGMEAQYGPTGWLEPHIVAVLDIPGTGLRRVSLARANARPVQRMQEHAEIADFTGVLLPNRFAATLLRDAMLEAVAGWRMQAAPGAVEALRRGYTQAWFAAAPHPGLDVLARAQP